MASGAVAIGILAGTAVAGTAYSIYSGERARSEQKEARRTQQKISSRETQRQRLSQFRESQIQRAMTSVQGEAAGMSESSTVQGAEGAIGAQMAGNIGFINSVESLRAEAQRRLESAAAWQGQAAIGSGIANLSSAAMSFVKAPAGSVAPSTPQSTGGTTLAAHPNNPLPFRHGQR